MNADEEDARLVTLSKCGRKCAFDQLFNKYRNRLVRHTERILMSKADAEDAVQEAFLKAFCGISSFREESSFFTWIFKISLNCALSSKRARAEDALAVALSAVRDDDWTRTDTGIYFNENPADEYQKTQLLRMLDNQLGCMKEIFAKAFILRELNGLSYDEIAEVMHCSVGTVRSRLFRARHLISVTLSKAQ